jgi:hypothetical protein
MKEEHKKRIQIIKVRRGKEASRLRKMKPGWMI